MTHAPLVCDLAVTIADVLHGREDAIEAADALIRGYVSVTPLEDEEAGLLADLVTARLATEITITAWRQGLYPDNAAYAASGEPGARAMLDAIEAMGTDAVARRFREACQGLPYRRSATSDLLERRRRALPRSPLFYEHPVHLVRGEGVWLFDAEDRRYLDCYNNVPVVGHSHPRVVQAVTQQQRLLATHSRYLHEAIVELAERLKATLPPALDAVMVVNSGSEANDLAWRIARAATGRSGAVVTDVRVSRADRGHARPVTRRVGQGRAAWPCRHHPRSRRVPRPVPAGPGRMGAAVRRPPGRRRPGARRPRPRRAVPGPGLYRRRHSVASSGLPAGSGPEGAGAGRAGGGRRSTGRSRPVRDAPVELPGLRDRARHGGDGQADGQWLPGRRACRPVQAPRGRSRRGRAVQHFRREPGRLCGRARGPGRHRGRGPGGERRGSRLPTSGRACWPSPGGIP